MMRFTWIDSETGETDINLFGANGQNDWEKGLGSALTYAERYFILKYFHISTDEDDIDNPNRKPQVEKAQVEKAPVKKAPVKKEYTDCTTKEELREYYASLNPERQKIMKTLVTEFALNLNNDRLIEQKMDNKTFLEETIKEFKKRRKSRRWRVNL